MVRRYAAGTVMLAIALMILAVAILIGSHYIYRSIVSYPGASAHGSLEVQINSSDAVVPSASPGIPMVQLVLNCTGPRPVTVTAIVEVPSGGPPRYHPYSATLLPGQSAVIYLPAEGRIGVETDAGVVWAG